MRAKRNGAGRADEGFLSLRQGVALAVCVALPVPLFAGSGLALPLPPVVYRLAVAAAEQTAAALHARGLDAAEGGVVRVGTVRLTDAEREAESAAILVRVHEAPAPSAPLDAPELQLAPTAADGSSEVQAASPAANVPEPPVDTETTVPAGGEGPAPAAATEGPEDVAAPIETFAAGEGGEEAKPRGSETRPTKATKKERGRETAASTGHASEATGKKANDDESKDARAKDEKPKDERRKADGSKDDDRSKAGKSNDGKANDEKAQDDEEATDAKSSKEESDKQDKDAAKGDGEKDGDRKDDPGDKPDKSKSDKDD